MSALTLLQIARWIVCLFSRDEHGIIAQHCRDLHSVTYTSVSLPRTRVRWNSSSLQPRAVTHASSNLDLEQRNELEGIIHDLEDENRLLQLEYERLCEEHLEKSLLINEQLQYNQINASNMMHDQEMLRQAKHLRQYKSKLEQRMKILEEHNQQLEKQLKRSKQLLLKEVVPSEVSVLIDTLCFSLVSIASIPRTAIK